MSITVSNSHKASRHVLEIKKGLTVMSSCAISEALWSLMWLITIVISFNFAQKQLHFKQVQS